MILNLPELSGNQIYHVMTQVIIPRPIAWVLSPNENKSLNLAPFSYFNAVTSEPPLLMLSVGPRGDGSAKDTRANIEARKDFVVHIAHRAQLQSLNQTAASLPAGQSEVTAFGIATVPFPGSPLPRVSDCPVAMSCRLYHVMEVGDAQAILFGEIDRVYLEDALVHHDEKGRVSIDAAVLNPIARLGANAYAELGSILRCGRPE